MHYTSNTPEICSVLFFFYYFSTLFCFEDLFSTSFYYLYKITFSTLHPLYIHTQSHTFPPCKPLFILTNVYLFFSITHRRIFNIMSVRKKNIYDGRGDFFFSSSIKVELRKKKAINQTTIHTTNKTLL